MKIPKSETLVPGVQCRTRNGNTFVITSNELRTRFTLWKPAGEEYERITTAKSIVVLYDEVFKNA